MGCGSGECGGKPFCLTVKLLCADPSGKIPKNYNWSQKMVSSPEKDSKGHQEVAKKVSPLKQKKLDQFVDEDTQ